jgi:hypothetical protein
MAKIIRLTESDLQRIVRRVINEQVTTPLETLLKNSGFINGIEGLQRQSSPQEVALGGVVISYIRSKNIPETNVYYLKSNGGWSIIIISGDKVLFSLRDTNFKFGRLPMMGNKIQIGSTLQTVQGTGGPKEKDRPIYMMYTDKPKFTAEFEKVTVDPKILQMNKIIPLMDKAFLDKQYVKGINALSKESQMEVKSKIPYNTNTNNIYVAIEGKKTPISIIQKLSDYKYKVILDPYELFKDKIGFDKTIDTVTLYNNLIKNK